MGAQGLGGFGQVGVLAEQAVADLPTDIVYAGISMGVVPAMHLAATRPGARAGVLLEAFVSPDDIGPWPADAPVQVHGMDGDEFFAHEGDLEAARAFAASHDDVEVFTYPGSGHLFVDSALTSYDADATALVTERVLGLLDRL